MNEPARYPRPHGTSDYDTFYAGVQQRELLIQRCLDCGTLRHPPAPMCGACTSLAWEPRESGTRGVLHSYVVHHHPPIPPFPTPHCAAVVDMDDGYRLVAGLYEVAPEDIKIGMPVEVDFFEAEERYLLYRFVPLELS